MLLNDRGFQSGRSGKVAVLQLGYEAVSGGDVHALVIQLKGSVSPSIVALLLDERLTFVGRSVGGDLKRLGNDYAMRSTTNKANVIELGRMARERDVVPIGNVSLERLVEVCFGKRLSKAPGVRMTRTAAAVVGAAAAPWKALQTDAEACSE